MDLERGTSRQWVMGRDSVKRWSDNGQPLTQEVLNSMMRWPGEARRAPAPELPPCPQCGERYCGDGKQPCTDCAAPKDGAEPRFIDAEPQRCRACLL